MPPSQRTRRSYVETDAQITEDHREGKDKLVITRASARAVYYALFDTLHAEKAREHEEPDIERLERVLKRMGDIGWPLTEGGD